MTEVGSEVSGILAAAYVSITLSTILVLTGLLYVIISKLMQYRDMHGSSCGVARHESAQSKSIKLQLAQ